MPTFRIPAAPLTGGVSRQPQPNRAPTQTQTADNAMLHIQRGLEKRYGTEYISSPDTATGLLDYTGTPAADATFAWWERSETARWLVVIDDDQLDANIIQVFDATTGEKKTVTIDTSSGDDPLDYIKSSASIRPKDKLKVLTAGDTAFILNKTVTTAKTGLAPDYPTDTGGDSLIVATRLKFPDDGVSVTDTNYEVDDVINLISADVGYPVGFYKVIADPTDSSTETAGPWYERIPPNQLNNEIDPTTFPVRLVYDPVADDFTLEFIPWNDRLSGNDDSNPGPSFIGLPITDIALFQDRLWFGAGIYVVSSQAGDLYNLWVDDWTNPVDSDPVDLLVSGSGVSQIQHLVTFKKTMVILADGARQYEITFQNDLSPSSANLVETTAYRSSAKVTPVKLGNQLYFVSDQDSYSYLWEYFYNYESDANLAQNTALHVEGYIPDNIRSMAVDESSGMLFLHTPDESNHLYTQFVYWDGPRKLQQAWCRFVFDSTVDIYGFYSFGDRLELLMHKSGGLWLESMPLSNPQPDVDAEGSVPFHLHMDRKISLTGTYSSTTGLTTFTLPFKDTGINEVVLGGGWGNRKGQRRAVVTTNSAGATTLVFVSGNFSAYPCWIGKNYSMSVELSKPYPKDQNNQVLGSNYQIKYLDILLRDSTTMDAAIVPLRRSSKTQRFAAARLGSALLGTNVVAETGRWRVRVLGDASTTTITLSNATPLPSQVTNMETVGELVVRGRNPTK